MKKKFFYDIMLNIITAAIPIGVLQLVIYPFIAKKTGGDAYGFMLTIYSLWMVISASLGNILNNTRLLLNDEYKAKNTEGDFKRIYLILHAVNAAAVFFMTFVYYKEFNVLHIILSMLAASFVFAKGYLEVGFRINLNYKAIAVNNLLLTAGYAAGFGLFYISGIWEFIFLFGYGASCLYCRFKTSLMKESTAKTELMPKVVNHVCSLGFSAIIASIVAYADKMVLYPLMGGYVVSVYFAATVLGKVISLLIGPVTSVMLSYISKWDESRMKLGAKIMLLSAAVSVAGYFIVFFLGKPVIGLLYPQWIDDIVKILPVTTLTIMISVMVHIINPFVLKFCNIRWQMGISGIEAVAYFGAALILWHFYGLMGFCIGTVIGKLVHLTILLTVYFSKVHKEKWLSDNPCVPGNER